MVASVSGPACPGAAPPAPIPEHSGPPHGRTEAASPRRRPTRPASSGGDPGYHIFRHQVYSRAVRPAAGSSCQFAAGLANPHAIWRNGWRVHLGCDEHLRERAETQAGRARCHGIRQVT